MLPYKLTFTKFWFFFLLNFRQLSVERDTLRNSLERESAKSKRLSLENEELQWRLVNSTSPPGTPTDEGGPTAKRNSYRLSANYPDVEAIDEWGYSILHLNILKMSSLLYRINLIGQVWTQRTKWEDVLDVQAKIPCN